MSCLGMIFAEQSAMNRLTACQIQVEFDKRYATRKTRRLQGYKTLLRKRCQCEDAHVTNLRIPKKIKIK